MKLTASTDRRTVPAGRGVDRLLRLSVTAPEGKEISRLPLNLALVLDRSGSMDGEKLERAKEAAAYCLRSLTSADRASLVVYDDSVDVLAKSTVLTPEAKTTLLASVRGVRSGGSTNLGGGWLAGAQEVARHTDGNGYLSRVILLSDGLANVGIIDPAELAQHSEELRKRGVSTTTMGVGADFNEDLMEQMALRGGGHFYYIENARQIPDTFHREIGEVLSTVARGVTLEIELPRDLSVDLLNSYEMEQSRRGSDMYEIGNPVHIPAPARVHVRLDDMISSETRSAVFKLHVPALTLGQEVQLRAWLRYTEADSGRQMTEYFPEVILRAVSEAEAEREQPDPEIASEAALLEAARAREEALRLDRAGNYAASAAVLASSAAALRAAPAPTAAMMADAAELEQYAQQAPGGLGGRLRKALHYEQSTRKQGRKK